jgi:hypothetical protein
MDKWFEDNGLAKIREFDLGRWDLTRCFVLAAVPYITACLVLPKPCGDR